MLSWFTLISWNTIHRYTINNNNNKSINNFNISRILLSIETTEKSRLDLPVYHIECDWVESSETETAMINHRESSSSFPIVIIRSAQTPFRICKHKQKAKGIFSVSIRNKFNIILYFSRFALKRSVRHLHA